MIYKYKYKVDLNKDMKRVRNIEVETNDDVKKPRVVLTYCAYQYTFGQLKGRYCNQRIPKHTKLCNHHMALNLNNNHGSNCSNLKPYNNDFGAKVIYIEMPTSKRIINNNTFNFNNNVISNGGFLNFNIRATSNIQINDSNINVRYTPTTIKESFDSLMTIMLNNNKFGIFYSPLY